MISIKPPKLPRELLLSFCRASMGQDVDRRVKTLTAGPINWETSRRETLELKRFPLLGI